MDSSTVSVALETHDTSAKCLVNSGPEFVTVAQHRFSIGPKCQEQKGKRKKIECLMTCLNNHGNQHESMIKCNATTTKLLIS